MTNSSRRVDVDDDWEDLARQWSLRSDTLYLNHGSFGPPPSAVRKAQRNWQERMNEQPMDFFVRQLEPAWRQSREVLARLIGARPGNVTFVENATAGMNIVAECFALQPGDNVLLTDHEYGAVQRIWRRRCSHAGAEVRTVALPKYFDDPREVTDAVLAAIDERTRLLVVSHITSPTAITLPIAEICRGTRQQNVPVCVDGPHAVAQLPLSLESLGCAYYTASCHKWLSAPFGSGFLYVTENRQHDIVPSRLSWGRLPPAELTTWSDEFLWAGTRDASPYLTVAAAIQFLDEVGLEAFRARTHALAHYARTRLEALTGNRPLTRDDACWYASMAHVPLPAGDARALQRQLWEQHGIEIPIIDFQGQRYIRVSCHLYNTFADIDRLCVALTTLL